jgi:hypothetical protein
MLSYRLLFHLQLPVARYVAQCVAKRACARSMIKFARKARITCIWSSTMQWNVLQLLTCKPVLATVATGLCPELATTKTPSTLLR